MGELRLDPLTGEWTIVAPRRGQRPGAATLGPPARPAGEAAPALDPNFRTGAQAGSASVRAQGQGGVKPGCPFCPGHEFMAPPAVREIPGPGGWQVRIVPNKYPAVSPGQDDGNLRRADGDGLSPHDGKAAGASSAEEPPMVSGGADSLFQRLPARGHHEVVVETPEHHQHPADMEPCRWAAVLAAWRDRSRWARLPRAAFLPSLQPRACGRGFPAPSPFAAHRPGPRSPAPAAPLGTRTRIHARRAAACSATFWTRSRPPASAWCSPIPISSRSAPLPRCFLTKSGSLPGAMPLSFIT